MPWIFAGRRRRLFALLLLSGVGQVSAAIASAVVLASVIGGATRGNLVFAVLALIALALTLMRFRQAELRLAERIGQDYVSDVRIKLLEAMITGSQAAGAQRHGIAMARLVTDLNSLKNWISLGIARVIAATLALAGVAVALRLIEPRMLPWVGSVASVVLVAGLALVWPLSARVREARRYRGRVAARVGELVRARETVLQLRSSRRELRRVRKQGRKMGDALAERMGLVGLMMALPEMLVPLTIMALAIGSAVDPAIRLDKAFSVLLIVGFLALPLRDLLQSLDFRANYLEARRRLLPIMRQSAEPEDVPRLEKTFMDALAGIAPIEISTTKSSDGSAATGTVIRPGRIHRIGELSRTHATLLFRQLCGLDPLALDFPLEVRLDGQRLTELSRAERRAKLHFVDTSLPLFRGSLRRNLLAGKNESTQDRLSTVATHCGLLGDPELPRGLRTRIREAGDGLSAATYARIVLARALLAEPDVLLIVDRVFVHHASVRLALEAVASSEPLCIIVASGMATSDS